MTAIDCWLDVNGSRFADTGADIVGGAPTALADLTVTWGRGTTVDQPEPATCRFTVADRSGGATFLGALDIGFAVSVWASGDISTGSAVDVAVDGSFETLSPGPAGNRVVPAPTATGTVTTVVSDRTNTGARAVSVSGLTSPALDRIAQIPPAAFAPGNPAAWDAIPRMQDGQRWDWSLAVWGAFDSLIRVQALVFSGPEDQTGVAASGTVVPEFIGDGTWHTLTGWTTARPSDADKWLGLQVRVTRPPSGAPAGLLTWADTPGTWNSKPATVTWTDYQTTWIDDQRIISPADALMRDVLVFSGRLTDLGAEIDDAAGTLRVEATAVDQMADLQNRYVGDTPWAAQTVTQRYAAIITASGADVDTRLDPSIAGLTVSRRDVDNQPAGGLLSEIA